MNERASSLVGRALPWRRNARLTSDDLPSPATGGTFRALRHRNYRLFYTGQSISLCGTWMQTIAQAWLVLEITDSEAALGVVTMLQFLPIMLFVLFAGVVADRVAKRDFLIVTQTLAMTQAAILALLVLTDTVELWHVYALALMLGLSNAFDLPTRQAFAIEMVGRDDLMNAVALNSWDVQRSAAHRPGGRRFHYLGPRRRSGVYPERGQFRACSVQPLPHAQERVAHIGARAQQ